MRTRGAPCPGRLERRIALGVGERSITVSLDTLPARPTVMVLTTAAALPDD